VPVGSTFLNPAGVCVEFRRTARGPHTIREKNGLTYTFESVDGAVVGSRAKLLAIADRNGNTLALSYTGGALSAVTDGLGRSLTFAYTSGRITKVGDGTGWRWRYGYDAAGNLTSFRNPRAVAGAADAGPVTYAYYDDPVNAALAHALERYTLPNGNGMRSSSA
jgi:YD repeat-containing protein